MRPSPLVWTWLVFVALSMAAWAQETVVATPPAAAAASTEAEVVAALIDEGLNRSQVMEHLDYLVNRIGPRLTSSDKLTTACEWARDQLQSWGWDARLEPWGTFPVGFNRGSWSGRMIAPESLSLTIGTAAWSAGTKGRMKGPAILAPMTDQDLASKARYAGHWVLVPAREFDPATPDLRDRRRDFLKDAGILGLVSSTGGPLVRTGGNYDISYDRLPTDIRINVIEEHFLVMRKHLEAGTPVELEFDIRNHFKKGPIQLYNVVADLKGTEKPDEYVIFGGHIDSWDGAAGTTDNGTGTSSSLEAARILAKVGARGKRTIRIMLWSGEEQGLLGSAAWVKANQDVLPKVSAVYVHDGGTNYVSGIGGTKAQIDDFKKVFAPVFTLSPDMKFSVNEVEGLSGGGSDHGSFLAMGVPGFFWNQSGRSDYFYGWHTQYDTYDIAIPDYQRHTATVVAVGAYGTANLDGLLSRENMRSANEAPMSRRRLGANFKEDTLIVESLADGSVAAKAGVQAGDILVSVDGVKLESRFSLRAQVSRGDAKKTLVVKRKDQEVALTIEFER